MSAKLALLVGAGALTIAGAAFGLLRLLRSRGSSAALKPVTPDTSDRDVTIIDNGGRPFLVRVSYKRRVASVYRGRWLDDAMDTSQLLLSFRFRRIFIGLDPEEREFEERKRQSGSAAPAGKPPTEGEPRRVWWHGGNTVLLDLGDRRYVCVCQNIFAFTAHDDIVDYVSTMGNNAVPYPFAVGTDNIYFMIEETYIPNHVMDRFSPEDRVDAYQVLYSDEISRWLPGADPREKPQAGGYSRWRRTFHLKDYTELVPRD